MQYFIGFSSFSTQAPFEASLFVEFCNRLGLEDINKINEKIVKIYHQSIDTSREETSHSKIDHEDGDKAKVVESKVRVPTQEND